MTTTRVPAQPGSPEQTPRSAPEAPVTDVMPPPAPPRTRAEHADDDRPVDVTEGPAWQRAAARLTESSRFQSGVIGLILLNALLLGLGTFSSLDVAVGTELTVLDYVLLGLFTTELVLRLAAVGFRPWRFLRRGWNVFDLVAVTASFLPGLGSNATALRLIRLLRVARLLSVVPDVNVLLDGIRRALRPAAGLVLLTGLLVYLYGIVGWSLFGEADPDRWGNIGESCLTLFTLLTLEAWSEILADARAVSPWAVVYVLSFILVGTFVVLNLLIGVVITSLDEAHKHRRRDDDEDADLSAALEAARDALDSLERQIGQRSRR